MNSINFKLQASEYNLYMSKLQTKIFFHVLSSCKSGRSMFNP